MARRLRFPCGERVRNNEEDDGMAGAVSNHGEHDEWIPITGEQLALRVFGVAISGVCGVIVLMVILGGWWAT